MREITPGLFLGNQRDYRRTKERRLTDPKLSILSACQSTHYARLNWRRGSVDKTHPNYIILVGEGFMSLNWVDGGSHLYLPGGTGAFLTALDYIESNLPILVHCDRGESRSATLGLLYLAKRARSISDASFEAARADFQKIYPNYKPGGIAQYVADHWNELK